MYGCLDTVNWIIPEWPAPSRVKALSTLRTGGYSLPPYDSFNLSLFVEDDPEAVQKNRKQLIETAKLPAEPCWLKQEHGTTVFDLDQQYQHFVQNANFSNSPTADASFSFQSNQVCVVTTADCLPVLLCDTKGSRVAAVHAGWRGLAAGVIEAAVEKLQCPSQALLAWLGPALGPDAFEVGVDVLDFFNKFKVKGDDLGFIPIENKSFDFSDKSSAKKWKLDIYRIATSRLNRIGITKIYGSGYCTYGDKNKFFSYRRSWQQGLKTGRMASLIWMI